MFSSVELVIFGLILLVFLMVTRIIPNLLWLIAFFVLILSWAVIPIFLIGAIVYLVGMITSYLLRLN